MSVALSLSPESFAASGSTADGDEPIIGGEKGMNGCIGSAGYTWSQVRQECIRLFEAGVPLYNVQDPAATDVAYVVNGGDQLPLELFLPDGDRSILLHYRDGTWRDDDGRYALSNDKNDVIEVRSTEGTLIFTSKKPNS